VALAVQIGCYSYQPIRQGIPTPATRVAVTLTDRGRVALAERLGAAVDRVEGTVLRADATGLTMAVAGTVDLRGGRSTWTGEQVTLQQDQFLGYQERSFSRGRTFVVAAIAVAVAVAIATVGLDLTGDGRDDEAPEPPAESRRR
jgi:hypothetical protein